MAPKAKRPRKGEGRPAGHLKAEVGGEALGDDASAIIDAALAAAAEASVPAAGVDSGKACGAGDPADAARATDVEVFSPVGADEGQEPTDAAPAAEALAGVEDPVATGTEVALLELQGQRVLRSHRVHYPFRPEVDPPRALSGWAEAVWRLEWLRTARPGKKLPAVAKASAAVVARSPAQIAAVARIKQSGAVAERGLSERQGVRRDVPVALPTGWKKVESKSQPGKVYFFSKLTGETRWDPPV